MNFICWCGGTGRRPGLKILWVVTPVPVRFRLPALKKDYAKRSLFSMLVEKESGEASCRRQLVCETKFRAFDIRLPALKEGYAKRSPLLMLIEKERSEATAALSFYFIVILGKIWGKS